uniref:ribonuclease kappa-B-like n=1 Tax=Myxine glutinosa TaxID=7769 RepID=UPI00358F0DF5
MVSFVLCGPKLSMCGIVLSIWGVIMLVLLGVFFHIHSAILIDDVPLTGNYFISSSNITEIYDMYEKVAMNCFIAAAVYLVIGIFSGCQICMNRQRF